MPTGLSGAVLITGAVFSDDRGFFREIWRDTEYYELGITQRFVQDNLSHSVRGALRGLHAQRAPYEQGKLITVISGSVFDVIVDLRPASATFLQTASVELRGDNATQLWVPPGVAHGFQALEEAVVLYKCTAYHSPEHEIAVLWSDPELGITWPIENPSVSQKDQNARPLAALFASK